MCFTEVALFKQIEVKTLYQEKKGNKRLTTHPHFLGWLLRTKGKLSVVPGIKEGLDKWQL